jgi:beta-lactamase class D
MLMSLRLPTLLGVVALAACTAARSPVTLRPPTCPTELDAGDVFARERVEGVFVLRNEATGCVQATDATMADQEFRPQSTFKIPNALIGLETGVIEGEGHVWRWDGAPRRLHAWEQDLNLAGALMVSCVPCFQDVARRVGAERMSRYLGDFGYGNQDISGPIDQFWLDGQLRITPRGQVEFLHRMLAGELPVKRSNVELVWRLLEMESGPGFTFRGKIGLGSQDGRAIGWLVGYVERDGHRWIYATLVRGRADADVDAEMTRLMPVRRSITRALLARSHVLPYSSGSAP